MLKKIFLYFSLFFFSYNIYSQQILKEIYYDSSKTHVLGAKEYNYDERGNIISINTYDADHNLQTVFKYLYDMNELISVNEYLPYSLTILKYSTFIYKNKQVVKKMDFDNSNNILLTHKFIYDKNGKIKEIIDILPNGAYLGKKQFVYKDNKLIEEFSFDEKNKLLIKKEYMYKNNLIDEVEFYTKQNIKIRVISRIYSKNNNIKLSAFGFNTNFFDFR